MRVPLLTTMMMLALLTLAPLAAAQEESNKTDGAADRPDDAAWVDDCPPDAMCAYGAEDCIECSRGPADGSCENCRGDDAQTCMDGAHPGESCDPDVQYLGGPSDGAPEPVNEPGVEPAKPVPGASFALVVAAGALAIFLLARRA